jgi:hypothetical protein
VNHYGQRKLFDEILVYQRFDIAAFQVSVRKATAKPAFTNVIRWGQSLHSGDLRRNYALAETTLSCQNRVERTSTEGRPT